MTRQEIIALVLSKIDEVSTLAHGEEFSVPAIIDNIMNDSVVEMLRNAPLNMLTPTKIDVEGSNFIHQINDNGTGHVVLPSSFVRLYSFKMQSWSRPAESAISISNPLYKLQHNAVTRGKSTKPVVAINFLTTGNGINDPDLPIVTEPDTWNALPPIYITDETIYHGSAAGEKHIPAGGEINQFLAYQAPSGNAVWSFMTDSLHGNRSGGSLHGLATMSEHGFMSSFDKQKLNAIQAGANYYEHPNTQGFKHIPQGGQVKDMLVWSAPGTAVWIDPATILELKIEQGEENQFFAWDKTWKQVTYDMISGDIPVDLTNYVTLDGNETITGEKIFGHYKMRIKGATGTGLLSIVKSDGNYNGVLASTTQSANRMWVLPDMDGTIALTSQLGPILSKATSSDINTGTDDEKYVTPLAIRNSNILSVEKTGQINGLTNKATPANNDSFIIDDSADSYTKKRMLWSSIITTLDNKYFGNVANQFTAVTEKTSVSSNDRFIIEDASSSYAKKSLKWSGVRTTLDWVYYGFVSSQFYATTEKTTLASNDRLIIEDSEATYGKKSIKWSTIVTAIGGGGGGATNLDSLTDVTITSPSSGHVLQYNGSQWVNATVSGTSHDRLHYMTNSLDHSMSSGKIIGRMTAGTGVPEELSAANVLSFIGVSEAEWKNVNITKTQIEAKLTGTITSHTHNYDNYGGWNVVVSGTSGSEAISSGATLTFTGSGGTTISRSGSTITISSSTASGGIAEIPSGVSANYFRGRDASGNAVWSLYSAPATHSSATLVGTVGFLTLNPSTQVFTVSKVGISDINASGTASSTTYLRGDGTWSTPPYDGFWASSTHGIYTNHNVGIGQSAPDTAKLSVSTTAESTTAVYAYSQYSHALWGVSDSGTAITGYSTTGNAIYGYVFGSGTGVQGSSSSGMGGIFDSVSGLPLMARLVSANTSAESVVLSIDRLTSGTASSDGIGGLIRFGVENSSGNIVYPAYIGARLSNAGLSKGELTFYCNSALRARINSDNDFELSAGSSFLVHEEDAYYFKSKTAEGSWRIMMDRDGLVHQRLESGVWVTKDTINA